MSPFSTRIELGCGGIFVVRPPGPGAAPDRRLSCNAKPATGGDLDGHAITVTPGPVTSRLASKELPPAPQA